MTDGQGRADARPQLWPVQLRSVISVVLATAGLALLIRLYLSLTSYCISGDGVAYLAMARQFASGNWGKGLGAVFSPLYPLLVAVMHRFVGNWELAGNLVSAALGTAAVVTVYLMTRQAFGRREVALGAAMVTAIHPEIAAYSASVRTEAGYILLLTATCWLLLKAVDEQRVLLAALAGVVAGLGYLYRTEGIGLLVLGTLCFAAPLWKPARRRWAFAAAGVFVGAFVVIAAPYMAYLRMATGHWSVGREFTAAMMYGMGDVARNGGHWRRLGFSPAASPLAAVVADPRRYVAKVGQDFVVSGYTFVQALGPLLALALVIGLWSRGRKIFNPGETLLAAVVIFYFCGFTLSYTGTRFMVHLIPLTFGWVTVGLMTVAEALAGWVRPGRARIAYVTIPAAIALALLPRTLWPIGYDMRGVRYAGEAIASMARPPALVAARDGRVAYYAGTGLVELPSSPVSNFCGWLQSHRRVEYVVVGNRDERAFDITPHTDCLRLLKRYPRYRTGYYDLFAIRSTAPMRQSFDPAAEAARR